jgi:hypothetical protein
MGLFVKKTVEHSATYDIGAAQPLLIVALGNIGKEYDLTRHNIGFEFADALGRALARLNPLIPTKLQLVPKPA